LNKEDVISSGLLEMYALGMTSAEETRMVEESLDRFPELRTELETIEKTIEQYAFDHAIEPGSGVRSKVFSGISKSAGDTETGTYDVSKQHEKKIIYRIPFYFKIAAAAVLLLLIGSIAINFTFYSKYKSVSDTLADVQSKMASDQNANKAMKRDLTVMGDKNAMPVVLKGTEHAPDALAKIYWMQNTGEVYVDASNLPAVPPGKQYQLWAIINGKPVDAGMIKTQAGVFHIQKMKSFGHVQAFAITMEKAGGSPTPTMDEMFVMGKI
jgi:anti-sigma-K factor RskA